MYRKVEKCRICGGTELTTVLDLGEQMLTGVFPRRRDPSITVGPLTLIKCIDDSGCGLVQLGHSYELGEMYGKNYGYRSGLNASMVTHLKGKVTTIEGLVDLGPGDLVIDIGSNDGTTLGAYQKGPTLVGVDPTGSKFSKYYAEHVYLIPEFFSADLVEHAFPNRKAKVVTSFSMFYDLEAPMDFMQAVYDILDNDGIWVFEQSYLPSMLATNSYDTVCHEHLEFYGLTQIKWMTDRVGFIILNVEFNDINGGSFSVTVKKSSGERAASPKIQSILDQEIADGLHTVTPLLEFSRRVQQARIDLLNLLQQLRADGKSVCALGASTKGNVLLQYCDISEDMIHLVGEVNPEKYGCMTPGTWLPIVSQEELLKSKPDYLLVLPWHFRKFFENSKLLSDQNLIFPLPKLEIRRQ